MSSIFVTQEEVSKKLSLNKERISSLRTMGKAQFALKNLEGTVEILLLVEKKGNVRVETGNFFGVPLSALTIRNNRMQYYVISEEKIYQGDPDQLLKAILPFDLTQKDFLGLLLFSGPTVRKFQKNERFELQFYPFKKEGELYYPQGLRLTDLKTDEYMEIQWGGIDINPAPFRSQHFKIIPPPQAQVIEWGEKKKTRPLFEGHPKL